MKQFNYNKKSINSSSESSLSEETTITVVEGSEESDSDYALPEKKIHKVKCVKKKSDKSKT
jgi:hypothetical protein